MESFSNCRTITHRVVIAFIATLALAAIQPSRARGSTPPVTSKQLPCIQPEESLRQEAETVRQFVESLAALLFIADGTVRAQRVDELRWRVPEFQRSIESVIRQANVAGLWTEEFDVEISSRLTNSPAVGVFF
jgi:hypothetical protein